MNVPEPSYIALTGGVGGAKLALGLSRLLPAGKLTIVANTGDDFNHLGFRICPDLDTVLYTLAGWNNKETGWGQAGESWHFLDALGRLGGETWFGLGDRDLATHLIRTQLLAEGQSLSEVTARLSQLMGVDHLVVPMTDDPVSTVVFVEAARGGANESTIEKRDRLSFQHYFVRDRCEPRVTGFEFEGLDSAVPSAGFLKALDAKPDAVIICPSNPFVSVDPVLRLPGILPRLEEVPVIAVSPIVGGKALKGPAAKMMVELGMPQTALGVARHYVEGYLETGAEPSGPGMLTGFVLDRMDQALAGQIAALGLATTVTNTVMVSLHDRIELAAHVLEFASTLRPVS